LKKASKDVEELNEKRTEVLNRVKYAEKEKNSLEGSKNEAEEYLNKKKEIIKNRVIMYKLIESESKKKILKENLIKKKKMKKK